MSAVRDHAADDRADREREAEGREREAVERSVLGYEGEAKTERCIDFDAFLTIVLQQYKSKDTADGLLAAFRARGFSAAG